MKKRCTNNKCRKSFTITESTYMCPHCKKIYPRLHAENDLVEVSGKNGDVAKAVSCKKGVYITGYRIRNAKILKAVFQWTKNDLREAKKIVDHPPFFIRKEDIVYKDILRKGQKEQEKKMLSRISPVQGFIEALEEVGCVFEVV